MQGKSSDAGLDENGHYTLVLVRHGLTQLLATIFYDWQCTTYQRPYAMMITDSIHGILQARASGTRKTGLRAGLTCRLPRYSFSVCVQMHWCLRGVARSRLIGAFASTVFL